MCHTKARRARRPLRAARPGSAASCPLAESWWGPAQRYKNDANTDKGEDTSAAVSVSAPRGSSATAKPTAAACGAPPDKGHGATPGITAWAATSLTHVVFWHPTVWLPVSSTTQPPTAACDEASTSAVAPRSGQAGKIEAESCIAIPASLLHAPLFSRADPSGGAASSLAPSLCCVWQTPGSLCCSRRVSLRARSSAPGAGPPQWARSIFN